MPMHEHKPAQAQVDQAIDWLVKLRFGSPSPHAPEQFRQWVSDERVTVLNQTPSAFAQIIAADATSPDAAPLSLRYVIMGGEALEPATLLGWLAKYGEDAPQIINMYGITETTVHVTWRRITLVDARQGGKSPIGEPLDDLEIYLLDAQRRPVPGGWWRCWGRSGGWAWGGQESLRDVRPWASGR